MKRNWHVLVLSAIVAAISASAAPLQFTNVTLALFPGLTNQLNAVTSGGSSNAPAFVAVGAKKVYVRGSFIPGQPWINNANWTNNDISGFGSNLTAIASSGSLFVASGDSNFVFSSSDGAAWGTNSKAFNNTALASGVAFNAGRFVTVAETIEIGWSGVPLTNGNWNLSTFANPSFIESFRGVTPYGTNGFAACGIFGDVRLSTNAAATWQAAVNGAVGQPDLFGIAFDGAKTLVCVGATNATAASGTNGVILVSTNSGVNWRLTFFTNAPATPINAVTYTGSGFVAVGKGGMILTSTNGVTWTIVPVNTSGNSFDLYGATFATNGLMKGVGELVGAQGTVLLAAEPPPAPVSLGNQSTCVGSASAPLQVSVTNSIGTNVVVVDWYDAATGGTQLASATYNFTPTIQTDNVNTTNHYWAQARDLRTGFVSTNRTDLVLTNFMRPTSAVVTTNTICNGSSTAIQINFLTGNSPWTVTWTDGFTNYVQIVTNTSGTLPFTSFFFVSPTNVFLNNATNHSYWVSNLVDAFCAGDEPGDLTGTGLVTINPRPTASVVTTNIICNGDSTVLQANLTGIGPWTVTWSDGFIQTVNNSPAQHTVSPADFLANQSTNYVYTVTAVSDANCTADENDLAGVAQVTVNPRPTANVSGNAVICNGGSTVLQANLTGEGPWNVTWSDGTVQTINVSPALYTVSPTNIFLNATTNYTYTVAALSDANCTAEGGDLTGSAVIVINPRPTATVVTTNVICNGGSTVLQANLTGEGPWNVTWSDGTVQTINVSPALYTVSPTNIFLNAATNYTYTVAALSDANCTAEASDLMGIGQVTINPRPTAALAGLSTTACNEGTAYAFTNILTGIGPWTVTWNDGTVQTVGGLGPVSLARVVNPTNAPFANMASNNIYYVTMVSNADTCAGNQPGDITGTNIITINPRPTAALAGLSTTACNEGTAYAFTNILTGIGPWTVTWNDGTVQTVGGLGPVSLARVVNPTNAPFANMASNNIYYVTMVSNADTCAGNQPGDITGTNIITINPRPTAALAGLSTTACNEGTAYAFTNILTGIGPWTVTWNDGTVQTVGGLGPVSLARVVNPTNAPFANMASNNIYYVTMVSNADTCAGNQPGDITGTNIITINPRPTAALAGLSTTACNEGTAYAFTNILTGIGPWTVTWNDGTVQTVGGLGPVSLARVVNPTNAPFANMASNNIYYVTMVSNADTCAGNQPGDITGTNIITINPRPTAALLTTNAICNGSSTVLQASLTGIGPWTVTWSDGTIQTVNSGPALHTVSPTNLFLNMATNYFYTITNISTANTCAANPEDLTGMAQVTVNPRPTAFASGSTNISISTTNDVTTLIQAQLTGIGPWTLLWSDGAQQITNFTPAIRAVTNHLSFTQQTVTNFTYQTNRFTHKVTTNAFPTKVNVLIAKSFTYSVTNLIDAGSADNCGGNKPGDLTGSAVITLTPRPTAFVFSVDSTNICLGDTTVVQATLSGIPPWVVTWSDGTVQTNNDSNNPAIYIVTPAQVGTIVYTVTNLVDAETNATPADLTGSVTIFVNPLPASPPTSDGSQTNCDGVANQPLSVNVLPGDTANWYDSTATNLVASGTTSFIPTNNTPGKWPYFATEVNASGCETTNQTEIDLILLACTNSPAISLAGTNGTIQWFGNLTLQSTTNLNPPITWIDVTNGVIGTNIWNWTNGVPPINFFRLNTN